MKLVTRNNINFLVNTDTVNKDFWDIEYWELENYNTIYEISKTTDTFINAGGWIGPFTLFAGKLFKNVFSLEPDSAAFKELKSNVDINKLKNVKLFNKAFSNKNESITIGSDYSDLGGSGTSIFQAKNSIEVEAITLESFFKVENIPINSFLMLDVEGAEYLLFDNFAFFESYTPTILLSLHLTFLSDYNFDYLIKCLSKLQEIYKFDLQSIIASRQHLPYKGNFREINILMTTKNVNSSHNK